MDKITWTSISLEISYSQSSLTFTENYFSGCKFQQHMVIKITNIVQKAQDSCSVIQMCAISAAMQWFWSRTLMTPLTTHSSYRESNLHVSCPSNLNHQ